jgi:carboxylesterase type B
VQYVFGHPASLGVLSFAGDDLALHEAMASLWTSFAATGIPAAATAEAWPVHELETDQHLVLDREIRVESGAHRDACALWE